MSKHNQSLRSVFSPWQRLPLLTLSSVLVLAACGGGSDSDPAPVPGEDTTERSVQGAGVKGPMINATVQAYLIDYTKPGLKGDLIATGTTDANAAVQGLAISARREGPFLIEVRGGTDHTSQTTPIIPVLKTIVTQADLLADGGVVPVYATPLSTVVVEMALAGGEDINGDGRYDKFEFESALREANDSVAEYLGFGILDDSIDLLKTPPLLTVGGDAEDALNYRTASEAFAALFQQILEDAQANGSPLDEEGLLRAIALDLSDDGIDGSVDGNAIAGLEGVDVYDILTQPVDGLMVPGTSIPVSDVNTLLITEAQAINPAAAQGQEPLPPPAIEPLVPGVDGDGDGIIDVQDPYPEDPTNNDRDGDNVENELDRFPYNGSEWADADGDCNPGNDPDFNYDSPSAGNGCGSNSDIDDNDASVRNICDYPDDEFVQEQTDAGCFQDLDGDGVFGLNDLFPNNVYEWADADGDFINSPDYDAADASSNYGRNKPNAGTIMPLQYTSHGAPSGKPDGYGDNGDRFPNNEKEWLDTDDDFIYSFDYEAGNVAASYARNTAGSIHQQVNDYYVKASTYVADAGFGDNADPFPNTATEWADCDSDGVGDNSDAVPCGYAMNGSYATGGAYPKNENSVGDAWTQALGPVFYAGFTTFSGSATGDQPGGYTGTLSLSTNKADSAYSLSVDFTIAGNLAAPTATFADITSNITFSNFSCTFTGSDITKNGCLSAMGNPSPIIVDGDNVVSLFPTGGRIEWAMDATINPATALTPSALYSGMTLRFSRTNGNFDQYDFYNFNVVEPAAYIPSLP